MTERRPPAERLGRFIAKYRLGKLATEEEIVRFAEAYRYWIREGTKWGLGLLALDISRSSTNSEIESAVGRQGTPVAAAHVPPPIVPAPVTPPVILRPLWTPKFIWPLDPN